MENKSDAIRREILKTTIQNYGTKGKKILVQKVKEAGAYKNYVDDNEVYDLILKFAKFHDLHIEPETPVFEKVEIVEEVQPEAEAAAEVDEADLFYQKLEDEHTLLSKKLLAINRLMQLYKNNQ